MLWRKTVSSCLSESRLNPLTGQVPNLFHSLLQKQMISKCLWNVYRNEATWLWWSNQFAKVQTTHKQNNDRITVFNFERLRLMILIFCSFCRWLLCNRLDKVFRKNVSGFTMSYASFQLLCIINAMQMRSLERRNTIVYWIQIARLYSIYRTISISIEWIWVPYYLANSSSSVN